MFRNVFNFVDLMGCNDAIFFFEKSPKNATPLGKSHTLRVNDLHMDPV